MKNYFYKNIKVNYVINELHSKQVIENSTYTYLHQWTINPIRY